MDIKIVQNMPTRTLNINKKGPRELTNAELMQISWGRLFRALGIYAAEKGLEKYENSKNK